MSETLISREEAAAHLCLSPESVRGTLRRHGITEQRGYPRHEVLMLPRGGRAARSVAVTAERVLIDHQSLDNNACLCGWSVLGASHARHVAQLLDAAGLLAEEDDV